MKGCIFDTENICSVYLEFSLAGGVGLELGEAGRAGGDPDGWSNISAGGNSITGVKAGWTGGDSKDWFAFSAEGAGMAGVDTSGVMGEAGLESALAGRAGGDPDNFSTRDTGLAWGGLVVAFFNLKIINYQTFAIIHCLN